MREKRTIPFGYTVKNGRTIIDPKEAEYIRRIFSAYISGLSMQEIADQLTADRVPFAVKTCDWCKARVARIIDNVRYTCSGEYDQIIEEQTYALALECKRSRQKAAIGGTPEIEIIRPHVKCEKCGYPMIRKVSPNCRIREAWTCRNDQCGLTVRIADTDLVEKVRILMNRVIKNSNLMIPLPKQKKPSEASRRLKADMDAEMQNDFPSEELILELIGRTASAEYAETSSTEALAARIAKQRVDMMREQETFNETYFTDIVKTVYLGESGKVRITTKTDADIYESENEQ